MPWWVDDDFNQFLVNLLKPAVVLGQIAGSGHVTYATDAKPSPSPSATPKPIGTPRPTPSAVKSASPTPTASPTATASATPSSSPSGKMDVATAARKALEDGWKQQQFGMAETGIPNAATVGGMKTTDPVYLGRMARKPTDARHAALQTGSRLDKTDSIENVVNLPLMNDKSLREIQDALIRAGYTSAASGNVADIQNLWQGFVLTSAKMYSLGRRLSPMDLLKRQAGGGTGGGSKTTTQTRYTTTNALTAEQLANAALSERLGRAATETDLAQFKAELAAAEKKNPEVTTTTKDASGNTTSRTKGGMTATDLGGFADKWALEHNKEEAAAFQTAGLMMPWLFEALQAPV